MRRLSRCAELDAAGRPLISAAAGRARPNQNPFEGRDESLVGVNQARILKELLA